MKKRTITIIGGGPVGCLQACYMAEKGHHVEIYEMRDDIRKATKVFGRSINLALSLRGREALKEVGLDSEVMSNGIPVYGRMIHDLDGSTHFIPYGKKEENIMSIDRRRLNELMVSAAEKYPQVHWNFCHKLVSCDFETKILTFEKTDTKELITKKFDIVIGCDGAYSNLRNHVMKFSRMKFSQEFIEDAYMELRIPPGPNGEFLIERNSLHIWPRHTFMMIGLPNVQDHSFVMTLFMPFKIFEGLDAEDKILNFFRENFKDALKIMGDDFVVDAFRRLSPLPLVSIKCFPYNYEDFCVLLGDAAHAMVPFYGQGLNCGLEDVLILKDFMNKYNDDFEKALDEFSKYRSIDAQTMNDLAMRNYKEMRSDVNTIYFYVRKRLDTFLHLLFPNTWIPLYTMVSFSRTRYHECLEGKLWQDRVLRRFGTVSKVMLVAIATYVIHKKGWTDILMARCKDFLITKI